MKRLLLPGAILPLLAISIAWNLPAARAQGCVAAHSPQPVISGLDPSSESNANTYARTNLLHGLTVTTGFRTYSSFRHYVGTVYQVQRAIAQNALLNHVDLWELDLNYRVTPRISIITSIPALTATRRQQGNVNVYRAGGIGDVTAGIETWVWRPPTESNGNIAFSAQLKFPTGINDAQGLKILSNGSTMMEPFDESIQPGDGTWGFMLGTEAYKEIRWRFAGYFTGSWLFNPQDTTGVQTFRTQAGEGVVSAADQYLWRGGVSRPITGVRLLRGLALSGGGRMEGVPVRDAFGKSNGFRRPGYVISFEPGLMYSRGRYMLNASGPWALQRDRKISVTDYANHTHGDAAFADYTVIVGLSRSF